MSKTSFELSAPIVWADGYVPQSGYSKLVVALGRVLGGLSVDGSVFVLDGTDFNLMVAQMMLIEAGVDTFVMGISYDNEKNTSFVAMADSSVWRFSSVVEGGRLITRAHVATEQEIGQDCATSTAMAEAIQKLAIKMLHDNKYISDGDKYQGHVVVHGHSSILSRPVAYGVLTISDKDGVSKGGFKFGIDGARNIDVDEAEGVMTFQHLTDEEAKEEKQRYLQITMQQVDGTPFPQKVGMA